MFLVSGRKLIFKRSPLLVSESLYLSSIDKQTIEVIEKKITIHCMESCMLIKQSI